MHGAPTKHRTGPHRAALDVQCGVSSDPATVNSVIAESCVNFFNTFYYYAVVLIGHNTGLACPFLSRLFCTVLI